MCGIVGYSGGQNTRDIIIDCLKLLEYRGYDSAGVAIFHQNNIKVHRNEGKINELEKSLKNYHFNGKLGIGHTRWATHGKPSEINAHPHMVGGVAVVHNGIIENYLKLKTKLIKEGHTFKSETDTEVISQLIYKFTKDGYDFADSVRKTLLQIKGAFAIAAIYENEPDILICARKESPLILGLGDNEYFVASDIPALLKYTRKMIFIEDEEMAVICKDNLVITDFKGKEKEKSTKTINWDPILAEKGGYKHFMLKEIHDQPHVIADTLKGRIFDDESEIFFDHLNLKPKDLKTINKIYLVACGTSWHAALVGKYIIEEICRIPCEVDLGSEFRYRNPIIAKNDILIGISQSGETADTLAALKEGKNKSAKILSICNVLESSMVRLSHGVIYTRAGPEIGVASTKAFTTQIMIIYLFSIYLASFLRRIDAKKTKALIQDAFKVPHQIKMILRKEGEIEAIAKKYFHYKNFLYLGRGIYYPIALEGALKLKEISYIHAEGYPAGEMKHGPIALIDKDMPVVMLVLRDRNYSKILGNIEEVKARDGKIIIVTDYNVDVQKNADDVFLIPGINPFLTSILSVLPLQLLAYHIAYLRGTDIDQPRNLAKSVTVE
ncbi:MAG: glutamine--fructose-6-phosphate transaminase (isomerizing) [Thermodesulfobacteriota bacterium]|nr:glutamine--fructose-6-phosphate transaminase (isomerizing) [Thermodesulfobacteriota bacterium]